MIISGRVSVYVPNVSHVQLNQVELYKLLHDYSDMILLVNDEEKWEEPFLPDKLKEISKEIDLKSIIHKLDRNEQLR